MRFPPKAPSELVAKPLSSTKIQLNWKDNSNNEIGFMLYRNGQEIATLSVNTGKYVDEWLRPATDYRYEIKAYNQVGESQVAGCSVSTLNPSIAVIIDKIGVHENGEEGELFRDYDLLGRPGKGEVRVGLVVTDGKTSIQKTLPYKGTYELLRDEVVTVSLPLYQTNEVGDSLRLYATAYEEDGGFGEQLIYKALNMAMGSYMDMPTSILFKLAGVDFSKIFADIFGAEDDWLGSYVYEWKNTDNWGVNNYVDVQCKRENGNVGLRLWFRIYSPDYDYSSEKVLSK